MIKRGNRDPKQKRMPLDMLVFRDILEFLAERFGMDLDFLEYTRKGTLMDDNGGFVDTTNNLVTAQGSEICSLWEDNAKLRDMIHGSVSFREDHDSRITIAEKIIFQLRELVVGRNKKVADLEADSMRYGRSLSRIEKELQKSIDEIGFILSGIRERVDAMERE